MKKYQTLYQTLRTYRVYLVPPEVVYSDAEGKKWGAQFVLQTAIIII